MITLGVWWSGVFIWMLIYILVFVTMNIAQKLDLPMSREMRWTIDQMNMLKGMFGAFRLALLFTGFCLAWPVTMMYMMYNRKFGP